MVLPVLPEELVQHIFSFLPTASKEKATLIALSSTSRAFHLITQTLLYSSVFFQDTPEKRSNSVDLFLATLHANPALGREVKKIELLRIFRGPTAGKELVMNLVKATKDSLEDLVLDAVELNYLADILAIPVLSIKAHLKRLELECCHIKTPATSQSVPPTNTVQTLRVSELFPKGLAMPYKAFPKLINFELHENETCESSSEFTPIANFIYNLQFQLVNFSVEIWELAWHWGQYPFTLDWTHLLGEIMTELKCSDQDLEEMVKNFEEDEDIEERLDRSLGAIIASSEKLHTLVLRACVLDDQDKWAKKLGNWLRMRSSEGFLFPEVKKILVELELHGASALKEYLADHCVGLLELKEVCQERGIVITIREEC